MKTYTQWAQDNPDPSLAAYGEYQREFRNAHSEELAADIRKAREQIVALKGRSMSWGATHYALGRALNEIDQAITHAANGY